MEQDKNARKLNIQRKRRSGVKNKSEEPSPKGQKIYRKEKTIKSRQREPILCNKSFQTRKNRGKEIMHQKEFLKAYFFG